MSSSSDSEDDSSNEKELNITDLIAILSQIRDCPDEQRDGFEEMLRTDVTRFIGKLPSIAADSMSQTGARRDWRMHSFARTSGNYCGGSLCVLGVCHRSRRRS